MEYFAQLNHAIIFPRFLQIRTFYQFRMWKQFHQWHVNTRWCKFATAQRSLAHNLFILQPCLSAALLSIKHLCNAVATLAIVKVDDAITYTLNDVRQTRCGHG